MTQVFWLTNPIAPQLRGGSMRTGPFDCGPT